MLLTYNSVALHTVASTADGHRHLVISGPNETFDPPEHPQRKLVQLRATLDLFATGVDTMQAKLATIRAALATQQATLRYQNPSTNEDYVNRTAAVVGWDPGEETFGVPVGSGTDPTMHRQVTITWAWEVPLTEAQAANVGSGSGGATFTPSGGSPVALTNIDKWTELLRHNRSSPFKKERASSVQTVTIAGWIPGDTSTSLASRRDALLTQRAALKAAMDCDEGTLVRASDPSWQSGVAMKPDEFVAQVNEAANRIEYTLSLSRTPFPDVSSFDAGEITVSGSAGRDTGQIALTLSGRVQASTYNQAVTRKDALIANVMAGYYGANRRTRTRSEQTIAYVSTPGSPVTSDVTLAAGFTEIQFREEWLVFAAETEWKGDITVRYASASSRDLMGLEETLQVEGELFALASVLNAARARTAGNYLDAFLAALAAGGGWRTLRDDRSMSYEALQQAGWTSGAGVTLTDNAPQSLRFSAPMSRPITGDNALLECRLSEDVVYSGNRVVEHELPDGPSALQVCGTTSASRTVSGVVRSASLAAATNWAKGKRQLLSSQQDPVEDDAVELSPTLRTDFEWIARPASGIADATRETGGASDVKIHVVSFTFAERMPELELE